MSELHALTQIYQLEKNKKANIYTDNGYIFGVVYDFGMLQQSFAFIDRIPYKIWMTV